MKKLSCNLVFAIFAIIMLPIVIFAADYSFDDAINLANITKQDDNPVGQATITLLISDDVQITADHDPLNVQLHNTTDTLVTEYSLDYTYNDSTQTGEFTTYDNFLSSPINIAYFPTETELTLTLHVRASNRPDNVSDSGTYTATQTLTVTWDGL